MPLNPEIPLQVRPFQGVNLLAIQENQRRQDQEARLAEQDAFEREKYQQERQTLADQAASRKILGEALRNAAGPNGIDRAKLMQSVPPEYLLPISEQLDKLEQSSVNMQKTRLEAAKLQREEDEAKGEGVRSLGGLIESLGNDSNAWQTARHIAVNGGGKWGSEEDLAPFDAAIAQDPSKVANIAQAMKNYRMRPTAQKNEDFTLSEGQIRYGPGGQVIARGAEKTPTNPTMASLRLLAAKGDPDAIAAVQMAEKEKQASEAKVGSFEDYVLRVATEKGKAPDQLTTAEIENARKRYQQADDRAAAGGGGKLTRVEHKDKDTGQTVIEYLTDAQIRGQKFEKGLSATESTKANQAQAVNQTGNDIISRLSDPAVRKTLGPVLGRYTSIQEFIGNPPPQYQELAGMIESYALANMGVHGMRSAQGAQMIKKMLDSKQTPESLIAAIRGLQGFSSHFLENAGRPVPQEAGGKSSGGGSTGGEDPDLAAYRARKKK